MPKGDLLPCPFCGGSAGIEQVGHRSQSTIYACDTCGCRLETGEEWDHGAAWNRRSDRAGLIAGLREAEAKARQFREHWSCAGGFGGHSAAARIIADTLSDRIAALETEEGKS